MKTKVSREDFVKSFYDYGRGNQFSDLGKRKLFDWLEDYEEQTDTEIELDVIALCCDYTELSLKDIKQETGCEDLEDLQDNTLVIPVDDETVIYQAF